MKIINATEFLKLSIHDRIKVLKEIIRGETKFCEGGNMSKINVIETRVREMLQAYPSTRENDNLLYVKYIEEYHYTEFNRDTFINYEEYDLPSFKSIERARRKIQNEYGSYKASEDVEEKRAEAEKNFRENYRG